MKINSYSADNNEKFVSIIVVNWNGADIIENFIRNIKALEYPRKEIIIIDNGSTDNSVDLIKQHEEIDLYSLPKNTGFAAGNNFGIRRSRGRYILLVNTDVLCPPNLLENLTAVFENAHIKKIGAVYPIIKLADNTINTLGSFLYADFQPYNLGFGEAVENIELIKNSKKTIGFYGACVMIERAMIEDAGLMNEEYFLYHEETDLAIRGYLKGWNYLLDERSTVTHLHSYSSKPLSMKKIFYSERNRLFNLLKYAGITQILVSPYYTFVRFIKSSFKKKGLHFNKNAEKQMFALKVVKLIIASIAGWLAVLPHIDILINFRFNIAKQQSEKKITVYNTF